MPWRRSQLTAAAGEWVSRFLRQGMSARDLARACALGVVFGLFPVPGATTVLCAVVAVVLRLNMAVIQAVNYAAWPVQLVLIVPFIQFGAVLFRYDEGGVTKSQVLLAYEGGWLAMFEQLGRWIVVGIGAWAIVSIPLAVMTHWAFLWLIRRVQKRG